MLTRIQVTAEDIAKGKRDDCFRDPICYAMERVIICSVEKGQIAVGYDFVNLYIKDNPSFDGDATKGSINFPAGVSSKLNLYDLTGEMKPFEFDLEIPDELVSRS
jgi:hypothetical protein